MAPPLHLPRDGFLGCCGYQQGRIHGMIQALSEEKGKERAYSRIEHSG